MKKTQTNKLRFFLFFVIQMCLFLFNVSCGLDTFEVIEEPFEIIKRPEFNDIDEVQVLENKYFEFYTNETGTYSEITFLGTEIYYKIYNDYNAMKSERSSLITASESTSTSATASQSLLNSYKKLRIGVDATSSVDLLVPKSSVNQKVYIRLTDGGSDGYEACVKVNGNYLKGTLEASRPVRALEKPYTFNFGRTGDNDKIPDEQDNDLKYTTTPSKADTYYVCLFAVGTGVDVYWTPQYSNILYLGTVTINSKEENN